MKLKQIVCDGTVLNLTKEKKVIEYGEVFEVDDGIYVDGELTVGENIADLGSVNCIVDLARNKSASDDDLRTLFTSYARLWASEYTTSYQKLLILSDTHSPDKIRVNAVLASIDVFYDVYDIDSNSEMYIEKSKRVKVW